MKTVFYNKKNPNFLANEKYTLMDGAMGDYGDPGYYPTYKFHVAEGVLSHREYQGYMSITYFLEGAYYPVEAKKNLLKELKSLGYEKFCEEFSKKLEKE